jgi:hypothetical protein
MSLINYGRSSHASSALSQAAHDSRCRLFSSRLAIFNELRAIHIPLLRTSGSTCIDPPNSGDIPCIQLPSCLEPDVRTKTCSPALVCTEVAMREASARESLDLVRQHLRTRTALNTWRRRNITGVRRGTRLADSLKALNLRVRDAADAYRRHRTALASLCGPGPWEDELRVLHVADVRGINERALTDDELARRQRVRDIAELADPDASGLEDGNDPVEVDGVGGQVLEGVQKLGEGYRTISWIWSIGLSLDFGAEIVRDPQMHAGK